LKSIESPVVLIEERIKAEEKRTKRKEAEKCGQKRDGYFACMKENNRQKMKEDWN
jgi:hypothetical protein